MRVGRWGTVLIAGVLLVAGCGDGGAADDTAESSGDTADAQTDSEPSEPADNSESEAPEPTPDTAAGGDFCDQIVAAREYIAPSISANDLADVTEPFGETLDVLTPIDVPDELADAWTDTIGFYETWLGALDGVDTSSHQAISDALSAAEDEITAASAAAQTAGTQVAAYVEQTCGVSIETEPGAAASAASSVDPCALLSDGALETVFSAGIPEPEVEDMGAGFAMCQWIDSETEVWVAVMPPHNMEDYLEAGGTDLDNPVLGEGAVTYASSIGLGKVSTGGGSVAFVIAETAAIIAVRGDAIADPVTTAIDLAESIN